MHRVNRHRTNIRLQRLSVLLCLLCIGIFSISLSATEPEPNPDELLRKGLVYVEPTNVITSASGENQLVPYRDRRPLWGVTLGVEYSSYEPVNYEPDFFLGQYKEIYGTQTIPVIEVQVSVKRNLSIGSLGVEVAGSQFENSSVKAFKGSTLSFLTARFGAVYYLDTLLREPYVIPYFSGGGYLVLFKESYLGNSFNGNTQVAPYINGGAAFALDWIDRSAAHKGYTESGVEGTFLFVELRKLMASSKASDPDFSNDMNWAAGFRIEF